jgi:hypothetical protein
LYDVVCNSGEDFIYMCMVCVQMYVYMCIELDVCMLVYMKLVIFVYLCGTN